MGGGHSSGSIPFPWEFQKTRKRCPEGLRLTARRSVPFATAPRAPPTLGAWRADSPARTPRTDGSFQTLPPHARPVLPASRRLSVSPFWKGPLCSWGLSLESSASCKSTNGAHYTARRFPATSCALTCEIVHNSTKEVHGYCHSHSTENK